MTFKIDDRVETKIAPPHPAAFAGTIVAIGDASPENTWEGRESGRILVRADNGIERVYTPQSLKVA